MAYANDITELIGNTPLVKLKKASVNGATVLGKCEFLNPTRNINIAPTVEQPEGFQTSGAVVLGLALRNEGDHD